jgi:hypothetical protein
MICPGKLLKFTVGYQDTAPDAANGDLLVGDQAIQGARAD